MSVIIETSFGDMTVDLYTDDRPRCCMNFLKLCKMKYYNFSLFHTVQNNLVAQTGDPTATGRGGESIYGFLYGDQARFFEMEVVPRILHAKKGLLSMVNNGSGMHGSQFFITLADSVDYLNNKHTVFGEVAEGLEIVDKLNNTFCDDNNRPHQDIRIYHTIILDDPYDDPDGIRIPSQSPCPTQEMLDSDRIPCDADIDDESGMTEEQLAEMAAEREAKANTQLLEMVGDLPDQDLAPPENVLFVCKLNPVTTSDDLEIIFSRFGTIVSCEVIKDQKNGESLQYAFVEFEKQQDCETAYFKMDNVLIDDRRIHVDFSQSVSKLKWKGKGRGVEIMKDGDAPKYILKNQERTSAGYDLVYAHDDLDDVSNKDKSHKKHKKSKKEDLYQDSKNNHRNSDRNYRRDDNVSRDRKTERYEDRDRKTERYEDMDRKTERYEDRDRKTERYEDRDREWNKGRRERSRSRDRDFRRHRDEDRRNNSQQERKKYYSDSDEASNRYRSRKDIDSYHKEESRKSKKSSRRDSYSDEDTHKKEKSKHKKHKSEKKKKRNYSDDEDSSSEVDRKKKSRKSDSNEEYRRKEKKKKRA